MPQRPRIIVPGTPLHITQRGVDRGRTFLTQEDFAVYLWALRTASEIARCAVHAYVLMTNHVHLLITPEDALGPVRLMQSVGRSYVRYFNDRYDRTGPLWEGRYRSVVVTSDAYVLACSRYIECNPHRAGVSDDPASYAWSSFRRNALGEPDPIVTPHEVHTALGADDRSRCAAYRQLFASELAQVQIPGIRTTPFVGRDMPVSRYQQAVADLAATTDAHPRSPSSVSD